MSFVKICENKISNAWSIEMTLWLFDKFILVRLSRITRRINLCKEHITLFKETRGLEEKAVRKKDPNR